jgi:hypothetical protein
MIDRLTYGGYLCPAINNNLLNKLSNPDFCRNNEIASSYYFLQADFMGNFGLFERRSRQKIKNGPQTRC